MNLDARRRTRAVARLLLIALGVVVAACGDSTHTGTGSGPEASLPRDQVLAIVDRYIAAFNTRDREGYLSLFADGATVEDPLGSPPIQGVDRVGAFFDTATASGGLHLELEPNSVRISGKNVAFRFQLELAAGTSRFATKVVDVLALDADVKIVALVAYWHPSELMPVP